MHFGRALVALLKFSTLSVDGMRARFEYEGEDRMTATLARGKGVLISSGHFGFWELQEHLSHLLRLPPIHIIVRPLLSVSRSLHRSTQARDWQYDDSRDRARCGGRSAARRQRVRRDHDRPAHPAKDAVIIDFFNRPAATTGAVASMALQNRGADRAGLLRAAAERPVPDDLRAPGRVSAGRLTGSGSRVDAADDRRARDVRATVSPSVAVDASAVTRAMPPRPMAVACFRRPRAASRSRDRDPRRRQSPGAWSCARPTGWATRCWRCRRWRRSGGISRARIWRWPARRRWPRCSAK